MGHGDVVAERFHAHKRRSDGFQLFGGNVERQVDGVDAHAREGSVVHAGRGGMGDRAADQAG